jgi:hypothetical protein
MLFACPRPKIEPQKGAFWLFQLSDIFSRNQKENGAFSIIDYSRNSTETIAPFPNINGVDTTFLTVRAARFNRSCRISVTILHAA